MTEKQAANIVWHEGHVSQSQRETLLKQKGALIWFTGLPSSGKSTVAFTVEHALIAQNHLAYVLDGDNIRFGLCNNLTFSAADRAENIRRIGEVGKLFVDTGVIVLASFVSPYRADRDAVRALMETERFIEIFVDTPLELCEARDPKGLYKKARDGSVPHFTGISDPYEAPTSPELTLKTAELSLEECALKVLQTLKIRGLLSNS